jgi:hypothetical protein
VQVTDAKGNVLQRADSPVQIVLGAAVRSEVVVPVKTAPQSVIVSATVIYRRGIEPGKSTPLESIKGIGPVIAAKLRAAGIPDVETFLRTPGEKLVEIAGFDAEVIKKEAERVVREGAAPATEVPPQDTTAGDTKPTRPARGKPSPGTARRRKK